MDLNFILTPPIVRVTTTIDLRITLVPHTVRHTTVMNLSVALIPHIICLIMAMDLLMPTPNIVRLTIAMDLSLKPYPPYSLPNCRYGSQSCTNPPYS